MTLTVPTNARGFGAITDTLDMTAVLNQLLTAVDTWVTTTQTEQSKRSLIAAWEHTQLERIRAQRDVFLSYLDQSFDERATTFHALFETLDTALGTDPSQVAAVLDTVVTLAKQSPFADLHDLTFTTEALADPDHIWSV